MEILGYIASLVIGISLGLIGAGGGILTVPLMVYLFHVPVLLATSYSLFIVGVTSLIGAAYQYRANNVNIRVAIFFGLISLTVVFLIRNYILAAIPTELFVIDGVPVTFSLVSMVLFSFLMIAAAVAMIRRKESNDKSLRSDDRPLSLLLYGILVGLVTGFLGAGGGFILIPSLVLLLRLPMKKAIGTSLVIIAMNCLVGFSSDIGHLKIDWKLLGWTTLLATVGIFVGLAVGKKISASQLRLSFGWFVLFIGIFILMKENNWF